MSSFGIDDAVFLKAEDLAESPRFGEATSKNGMLAFTLKTFAHDATHSSVTDLYVFESGGSVKQMTRLETGGVSNPAFAPDVLGSSEAVSGFYTFYRQFYPYAHAVVHCVGLQVMYLQGGQVRSLSLDGGESAQVSSFPLDVDSFKVFKGVRDTVMLACVMSVYPDKSPQETADIDASKKQTEQSSGMVSKEKTMISVSHPIIDIFA
jgi:hypothetical protein